MEGSYKENTRKAKSKKMNKGQAIKAATAAINAGAQVVEIHHDEQKIFFVTSLIAPPPPELGAKKKTTTKPKTIKNENES